MTVTAEIAGARPCGGYSAIPPERREIGSDVTPHCATSSRSKVSRALIKTKRRREKKH